MSNAEHLLENTILAMKDGIDPQKELESYPNTIMLKQSGFTAEDFIRMACHVVYSLYGGKFPEFG